MKSKWYVLLVIIFMYLPVSIDATVLYVVAPVLSTQLQASHHQLLWIMDIYPLIMAALLLPMGSFGDRIGYKKMAIAGSMVFGIASAGAAFSQSPELLIAARALLAVGAAMIVPATLAAVRKNFTDDKDRNMALGIWTTIGTGGALAGPLVGGALLRHFYWGSGFLINVPLSGAFADECNTDNYLWSQEPYKSWQPRPYVGLSLTGRSGFTGQFHHYPDGEPITSSRYRFIKTTQYSRRNRSCADLNDYAGWF